MRIRHIFRSLAAAAAVTAALFAPVLAGCRDVDRSMIPSTVAIPEITVDSAAWSGIGNDKVVATVDDIRIPAWRVRSVLGQLPPGTPAMEALDLVIAEELVARKAAGDRAFTPDRKVYEKTLAARWIEKHLISGFGPADVPYSMLAETFAMPQVWAKFNHPDLYEIQDYQWICCEDPRNCDPAVSDYCFKEGEGPMRAVYEALLRDQPAAADLSILALDYRKLAYHMTYQEYQFAFDKTAGYQKGATHIDKTLAAALMNAETGTWLPPVKSEFGWHVPYLKMHHPEIHGDLSNPAVRTEISEVFIQRFRQQYFLELLAGLVPTDSLKLLQSYYEGRHAPAVRPVYDVVVDRDALRDSAAGEAGEKEAGMPNL